MINQYAYIRTNKKGKKTGTFKDELLRFKPFNFRKNNKPELNEPKRQKYNNKLELKAKTTLRHYNKIKCNFNCLASEKNFNIIKSGTKLKYTKINGMLTPLTHNLIEVKPINKFEVNLLNKLNSKTLI